MMLLHALVLGALLTHPEYHATHDQNSACEPYELGFNEPSHSHKKQVAFTFDDGPDGERGETDALLDQLKKLHIHASFFVCADNWVSLLHNTSAQQTIRRIVADGHELGNHTSHHYHLPALTPEGVFEEFASTQQALMQRQVLGDSLAPITLLRAPYGQPFEADPVNRAWVAPIVARLGVHIGWNINSYDWACATKTCVVDNVTRALDVGLDGAILMHSNYRSTTEALPILVEILQQRGYEIVSVEQLLQNKYGAPSKVLHERYAHGCMQQSGAKSQL